MEAANTNRIFEITDAVIDRTRASKAIFAVLCFLPVISTILFGGVDTIMLGFFAIVASLLILLWSIEAWKTGLFRIGSNILLLPLVGLILIGLIQLLPFGESLGSAGLLSFEAARSLSLDPFATRLFIVRLVIYLIFFAAAFAYIDSNQRAATLSVLIVVFGTLVAFFGILQRLANPEAIYGLRPTPQAIPFGPFINQHHFA